MANAEVIYLSEWREAHGIPEPKLADMASAKLHSIADWAGVQDGVELAADALGVPAPVISAVDDSSYHMRRLDSSQLSVGQLGIKDFTEGFFRTDRIVPGRDAQLAQDAAHLAYGAYNFMYSNAAGRWLTDQQARSTFKAISRSIRERDITLSTHEVEMSVLGQCAATFALVSIYEIVGERLVYAEALQHRARGNGLLHGHPTVQRDFQHHVHPGELANLLGVVVTIPNA